MPVRLCVSWVLWCACWCAFVVGAPMEPRYAGPQVCANCHESIAAAQRKTPMAGTWQTERASALAGDYDQLVHEGNSTGVSYRIRRTSDGFLYETKLSDAPAITLPVEDLVGGPRHGISFLTRIQQLEGIPLERPALIEGRYAFSTPHRQLILSPGFPSDQPQSFETAFGSVLSPTFEKKCLLCHGEPNQAGAGQHGGVGCESCHGPGLAHTQAATKSERISSILNPRKISRDKALEVCAQCHTGFSYLADPLPDDLLISSQVTALRNSECFIQSNQAIGCTGCHDPHQDTGSAQTVSDSVKTCLGCHSRGAETQAALCPVNAKDGCIGCHMPTVQSGAFGMVDHWIRVHPENIPEESASHPDAIHATRTLQAFLRILLTNTREAAETARSRVSNGEDFFDVSSQSSIDPSRQSGGFIGLTTLSNLDPRIANAAADLRYGQTSEILDLSGRWMIVQRLPRDFRMDADRLFHEAVELKAKGNIRGALERDQQALKVNPSFLRALLFMGTTLGETGQVQRAADVLTVATELFPKDSVASFNLGIVLGGLGKTDAQIQAFRRAIEMDPDNVPVYESLGAALHSVGDSQGALKAFHDGLRINPLSAALNYDLSLELAEQGDKAGALRTRELALKINPKVAPPTERK